MCCAVSTPSGCIPREILPLPIVLHNGERVGVRGREKRWSKRPPLTLTLSPRKCGERGLPRSPIWRRSLPTCVRGATTWNPPQFRSCPSLQTSRRRLARTPDAGSPPCRAAARPALAYSATMRRRLVPSPRSRARIRTGGSCRPTSTALHERSSVRAADAEADDLGQSAGIGVGREDGERVAGNGTVVPGAFERGIDGVVLLQ